MTMVTRPISKSISAGSRAPKNLPAPRKPAHLDDSDWPATEPRGRSHRAGNRRGPVLSRPRAPFLVQLSLQYDGVGAARRARRHRIETANGSYTAVLARSQAAVPGARHDIRA